jgi:glycosyltransferase involved in cell wall biosynthesis
MHSSLPQQLRNFEFTRSKFIIELFESIEEWILKYSSCVITICPDLEHHVKKKLPKQGSVLIENVIDYGMIFGEKNQSNELIKHFDLEGKRVALYAGTFEPYQGLDLLITSAPHVISHDNKIRFLMVGGHRDQIEKYKQMVDERGLTEYFIFTGQVQPQEVNSYIRCADILLSPRISGTNTPLKIYSYLRSGVPIVATRLWTHTQVLKDDIAVLTEPKPEEFAQGILWILQRKRKADQISQNAKSLAQKEYSYKVYLMKFREAIDHAMTRGA